MNETVKEFKQRFPEIQNRSQLLKLEEDLIEYMASEIYKSLSEDDKNTLDDLLMEVTHKKGYFLKGCDPWKSILS